MLRGHMKCCPSAVNIFLLKGHTIPYVWYVVRNMWLPSRCTSHSPSAPYYSWELFQHSVGRTSMINLPAELGWISKNLPLGPRAAGRFLTDLQTQVWVMDLTRRPDR